MGLIRDFTDGDLAELRGRFSSASPYPHVVIDDFLDPAAHAEFQAFPNADWPHWSRFRDAYQKEKRVCADLEVMPRVFVDLIAACGRPRFLGALETITGMNRLITDPYLDGGGLHCSGPGGVLVPHTDFHVYGRLALYRRLNLLIYLNPDWGPDDGGELELFRKGETEPAVSVVPKLGRAVVFRTDDRSVHGFSRPVAEGRERRSVALYYYDSTESADFAGDTGTHWRSHGRMTGVRLAAFNALILASRAFSRAAHAINPNRIAG
jgi:Rps23 Pro-64 3,4-dihydroxylase Tpa1-like proline 4-hydroxylase